MALRWEARFRQDAQDFVLDGGGANCWKTVPQTGMICAPDPGF